MRRLAELIYDNIALRPMGDINLLVRREHLDAAGNAIAALGFRADLRSMPDWRQRLHFARANVLPSADYMRQRYGVRHPLLLPIYYPWRRLRGLLGLR